MNSDDTITTTAVPPAEPVKVPDSADFALSSTTAVIVDGKQGFLSVRFSDSVASLDA